MGLQQTIVNTAVLAVVAGGGWFLYGQLVDRGDEIIEAGDTVTGSVTDGSGACTNELRRIHYTYKAAGLSFDAKDEVPCEWEVPTLVTVAYMRDDPAKSRVLTPTRTRQRVNAGR